MSDIQKKLDYLKRAYDNGSLIVVHDAVKICKEHNLPLPDWLAGVVMEMANAAMENKKFTGNYSGGGCNSKYENQQHQDMVDYFRATQVGILKNSGIEDKIYVHASVALQGTEFAGTPDAIEKSYKRFYERLSKNPHRYYIPKNLIGKPIKLKF